MANKGETRSENETLELISMWVNYQILLGTCHKTSVVYKEICREMTKACYNRDFGQCETKLKHLKIEYKKFKDSHRVSGAARKKKPRFFKRMDIFLGDKPQAVGLERAIDTSSTTSKETVIQR